ncbi:alpha/beta hydrolase [Flavihumibacter sp. RY-1]|uniref:Alpha/beta hydrolase n=1 Tax=Flavihumibacter fluminis TaxID=2909236 RepID=A0ABS9BEP6_9BACT|nr:alpha/beta hydrolase [Flavihumibacter fluminis]MCF1714179.1 alpha/beta hydrolase [Flavihumibacter fluminis]
MIRLLIFFLFLSFGLSVSSQVINYGNNPQAGKYLLVEDATLYYEVYGTGKPLLLLHGDTFGYITEFEQYIPILAKEFKVIIPAMRGHGKSEIGTKKYSYKLFAQDVLAILHKEEIDKIAIMGFSAGATTACYLAAYYPESIKKAVVLAGAIDTSSYKPGILNDLKSKTGDAYEQMLPELVKDRKKLMPKPNSFNELIQKLKEAWLQPVYVEEVKLKEVKCPVLIVGGDRDEYMAVENFDRIHQLIPTSQLAILPNCNHIGLLFYPEMVKLIVLPFLLND